MGSNSSIEWTNSTWNPLAGCSMCSPGCANCYAEKMAKRLKAMAREDIAKGRNPGRKRHYLNVIGDNGKWNGNIALIDEALVEPLSWKKPRRVFANSMSDLFHEGVPFDFIDKVFAVMALTPHHTFQILTKRPERMAEYVLHRPDSMEIYRIAMSFLIQRRMKGTVGESNKFPLPSVWLGTSVENQKTADERIPHLLQCPAAVRFLSCEPLLGPVDLSHINHPMAVHYSDIGDPTAVTYSPLSGEGQIQGRAAQLADEQQIQWVIVGGESGPGARPCHLDWVRSLIKQCGEAGAACFVKQLGAHVEWSGSQGGYGNGPSNVWPRSDGSFDTGRGAYRKHLIDKKGGDMSEWPEDLRVRQFPAVKAEVLA
jgi:protein gp37